MEYRRIEQLLPCPYNTSHQILPHRMAQHLVKCSKNYPDAQMKTCVFNATHVVPVQDYQFHILNCENRQYVDREMYERQKDVQHTPVREAAIQVNTHPSDAFASGEDWDAEVVKSSYNPKASIIYKEFSRPPPPGMGKAERRAWRQREVERVERLKNGEPIHDLISECESSEDAQSTSKEGAVGIENAGSGRINMGRLQIAAAYASFNSSEVMRADQPLRRPKISSEPGRSRIAANIFGSSTLSLGQEQITSVGQVSLNTGTDNTVANKEFIKEKRKLEKKLCEIDKLQSKKKSGVSLTEQEDEKVTRKSDYEAQLTTLLANIAL